MVGLYRPGSRGSRKWQRSGVGVMQVVAGERRSNNTASWHEISIKLIKN